MEPLKRILVTGASGFVGKAVCSQLLRRDFSVSTIGRSDPGFGKHYVADLTDQDSMANSGVLDQEFDCVFHFAWTGVDKQDKLDLYKQLQNLYITANLFTAKAKWLKRIVTLGSSAEFEKISLPKGVAISGKENPTKFINRYAALKFSSRNLEKDLSELTGAELIQTVVGSVYGPGRDSGDLLSSLIKNSISGLSTEILTGNQLHDYIYINDLARALVEIGERGRSGETYGIPGFDRNTTLKSFLVEASKVVNTPKENLVFRNNPAPDLIIDGDKIEEDLTFYSYTDFTEGVGKTFEWFKTI